jgi:DNA-directed RNA polymerase specialized sigma24 family protein
LLQFPNAMPTAPERPPPPLEQIGTTVRAILRRKSGMSLRDDDTHPDNVEAIELLHEVMVRLLDRQASAGAAAWDDLAAYAATTAHNAWSDHLRQKYPKRASLKNRLRYFLSHQPRYDCWNGSDGDLLAGLHAWRLESAQPPGDQRVAALREGRERLPAGSVPRKALERFEAPDWDRLLGALFERLRAPLPLDGLVSVVATLVGLKEDRTESLDALADDDGELGLADDAVRTPEEAAEVRSMLRELWGAVLALKPDYRAAYLLNLPGPGKTRADIEVFVLQGVASLTDIEQAIGLERWQYGMAFDQLPLDAADRAALDEHTVRIDRFCVLWKHLPLADALIGRLLGLEQQQVINRRMLALRELARLIAHRPRPRHSGSAR